MHPTASSRGSPMIVAVAAPLAILALAYGLWAISDRLIYIGPLDRALFGWLIVAPVLASAPVAAGFAWRKLTLRGMAIAAMVVATGVAAATWLLFWASIANPDCQFGSRMTDLDEVRIAAFVGLITGCGYALSGLVAATLVRRCHPWWGAILGAGAGFGMIWVAVIAAFVAMLPFWGMCERPI